MNLIPDTLARLAQVDYSNAPDIQKHIADNVEDGWVHPQKFMKDRLDAVAYREWCRKEPRVSYAGLPSRFLVADKVERKLRTLISWLTP